MVTAPLRGRHTRAVTLLEVAVVATLASIIFLLILRWLLTLVAVDTATLAVAQARQAATVIETRLGADLAAATGCVNATGPAIRTLSPNEVTFYSFGGRTDATTGLQQVTWALQDGQVERTAVPILTAADCTAPSAAAIAAGRTTVIATSVTAGGSGTADFFTALPSAVSGITCTTTQSCPATGLLARASVAVPNSDGVETAYINRAYTVRSGS